MPVKMLAYILGGVCLCALAAGCNTKSFQKAMQKIKPPATQPAVPPYVKGTVAEFAALSGGGGMPLQAYGVVIGLGTNGSAEVPAHLAKGLEQYLYKQDLGSARMGTQDITPKRVLEDLDTAVVLVGASIPPGAPVDTRFDVFVSALPDTQTRSLDGGLLMPIDLSLAYGGVTQPNLQTQVWGTASGQVFVNPFIDPADPNDQPKLRSGRILNGGKVTRPPIIQLELIRPDYSQADLIQRCINERFPTTGQAKRGHSQEVNLKTANALSRSMILIDIPPAYRNDYQHFLALVTHLPVHYGDGGPEAFARRIAAQMELPDARCEELSLIWEAMGRQVLNAIQGLYTSTNPAASFDAARAGLRLGDTLASEIILRVATTNNSPLQLSAIEELGRHGQLPAVVPTLRQLLDSENENVRIAAYESLLKLDDHSSVTRLDLSGQFKLDIVQGSHAYGLYATQTGEPKIVLFGQDMIVSSPTFFQAPEELVTITAAEGSDKLKCFRKVPRTGKMSDTLETGNTVQALIEMLGRVPERDEQGKIAGLGLTYSQVVGVLYRLGEQGDIPVKMVLQELPEVQKMYEETPTVGRPDTTQP